jgi:hypothetical protein
VPGAIQHHPVDCIGHATMSGIGGAFRNSLRVVPKNVVDCHLKASALR